MNMKERLASVQQSIITSTPSVSTAPTFNECCGLFDLCADADLMSLSFQGVDPFLDWLTWRPNEECEIDKEFIAYVRPARSNNACTTGVLADPCANPVSYEFGKCEFKLHDFARLRRRGPIRDITTNRLIKCKTQPRYRLDGVPVTDTMEMDMLFATETIIQDLRKLVIIGNHATPGSADGLQVLLSSDYHDPDGHPCPLMNSNVINWAGQPMSGGNGITWNGTAIANTYDFIDVLLAVYRRIRQRLSWAPMLNKPLVEGDMVLMLPNGLVQCVLDMFTCWSVCANSYMDTFEGRTFRNSLNGGMFGAGTISLDGFRIPLLPYDWETISGPNTGDIYLLTGKVGATRLIEGQYLPMNNVPADMGNGKFGYTDGGRILTWEESYQTCYEQVIEMRPRILAWAPWAQAVFNSVRCVQLGGFLSPDACDTSFFPGAGSISPAECPEDEEAELI